MRFYSTMKGLWYQKICLFCIKLSIPEQSYFKKNYGSGGHTIIFLKSHNSAHTCRNEKRFSVFCPSSDALSDDISLTQKVKNKTIFPMLVTSASVTSSLYF